MCKDYRPRCVQDRMAQRNTGRLQTHMGQVLNGENGDVPTVVGGLPQTKNKCKKEGIQGPKRTQHHWFRPQEDNTSNTMNR